MNSPGLSQLQAVIERLQSDLDAYAARPDRNPVAVEVRMRQVRNLILAYNTLELELQELERRALSWQRAWQDGLSQRVATATKACHEPRRHHDPEMERLLSIQRARQMWPELY